MTDSGFGFLYGRLDTFTPYNQVVLETTLKPAPCNGKTKACLLILVSKGNILILQLRKRQFVLWNWPPTLL